MSTKWGNQIVDVDNAAIAAAVAAAVDIPTALENGTAAATAVGAQAACAAAITAAGLPAAVTGGGYGTTHALVFGDGSVTLGNVWRSCVTAISDSTAALVSAIGVEAACDAAITAADLPSVTDVDSSVLNGLATSCAAGGSVHQALAMPNGGAIQSTRTGATSYAFTSVVADYYAVVYGFVITSDLAVTFTWKDSDGNAVGFGPQPTPMVLAPGQRELFRTPNDTGLVLHVSSAVASLSVVFWGELLHL